MVSEADLEVGQATLQESNYLLRKTKLKAIFALIHRCSTYLKSASRYPNWSVLRILSTYQIKFWKKRFTKRKFHKVK